MTKRGFAAIGFFVVTATAACYPPASTPTPESPPAAAIASPLLETRWIVSQLDGAPLAIPDLPLTLIFGGKDTVIGDAGCTEFRGAFTSNGSSVTLGPLTTGTASCGQAVDLQEQAYVQALQAATGFAISGAELSLFDAGGKELVRLSRWGGSGNSSDSSD